MTVSRRGFLGLAAAAGVMPGGLLAAVEAQTPALPALDDWEAVRRQFALTPEYLHFSNFFIASHPAPVRDAIEAFRRAIDANPFLVVEHGLFTTPEANLCLRVQEEAARYLGGRPQDVALTGNTTTGLALVYQGLPLRPGDEVLVTTHDHYSHHESVRLATRRAGAAMRKVALYERAADATADAVVARLRAAIGARTRVVGVTWVHSSTGIRLPVPRIAAMIAELNRRRRAGRELLLVVDGVHGLGAAPESIAELGADYFCAGTHKWMLAPRGTGILWARPEAWARLTPTLPTFSELESYEAWMADRDPATPTTADRIAPGGFHAYEHVWGMAAAFRLHQAMGRTRVAARIAELASRCKDGLAAVPGLTLHTPRDPALSAGLVCFELAGLEPKAVVERLLARRVIASTSPYALTYARLAPSLATSPEDVDRAVAAVADVAASAHA